MLDRGRASIWDEFGSEEEFERELRELMPYAPLARSILALRAGRGMTQQELADKVGTTQSVISRLESGEHDVRIGILNRIADALDLQWRVEFQDPRASVNAALERTSVVPVWPLRLDRSPFQGPRSGHVLRQPTARSLLGRRQSELAKAS